MAKYEGGIERTPRIMVHNMSIVDDGIKKNRGRRKLRWEDLVNTAKCRGVAGEKTNHNNVFNRSLKYEIRLQLHRPHVPKRINIFAFDLNAFASDAAHLHSIQNDVTAFISFYVFALKCTGSKFEHKLARLRSSRIYFWGCK